MILEEAAYIPGPVIKEVLTPVLIVNKTVVIMISTIGKKSTNIFTKILKSEFFDVVHITFICAPCLAKGETQACIHNRDFMPSWTGDNMGLVNSIFDGDEETFARENLGVVTNQGPNCFKEVSVLKMMNDPKVSLTSPERFVFVCVDPSGGSDIPEKRTSDFAIVSICGPNTTIVGIDAVDAAWSHDYEPILIAHLTRIREMPMLTNATIVIDAESGTGYVAGDVEVLIRRRFENVVFMSDFTNRKPGTLTTNPAKAEMVEMMNAALEFGDIRILRDMITSHKQPKQMMSELQDQMLSYERVVCASSSIRTSNTVKFTGKASGKLRDDLCVTLQRCIRARHRFKFGKEYRRYLGN